VVLSITLTTGARVVVIHRLGIFVIGFNCVQWVRAIGRGEGWRIMDADMRALRAFLMLLGQDCDVWWEGKWCVQNLFIS